jgi:hypothetical protein
MPKPGTRRLGPTPSPRLCHQHAPDEDADALLKTPCLPIGATARRKKRIRQSYAGSLSCRLSARRIHSKVEAASTRIAVDDKLQKNLLQNIVLQQQLQIDETPRQICS